MNELFSILIKREGSARQLAIKLQYDPSYICRIRQGKCPLGKPIANRIKEEYKDLSGLVTSIQIKQALED